MLIPSSVHGIDNAQIDAIAIRVLQTLLAAGHASYLVGGGVRDLLLGQRPKDFDIATSAEPERVRALFRRSRIVGKRFRLVHVRFGRDIVEVATFRAGGGELAEERQISATGRLVRDNVFGSIEDDAWRRDFTVNALYYDIRDYNVLDFTGGYNDVKRRKLQLIGDPITRFREDPVRLLRAIRFVVKNGLEIDFATAEPIKPLGHLLEDVPAARLFDETLKLFMGGYALQVFAWLERYELFRVLFPETGKLIDNSVTRRFIQEAFRNTDSRLAEGKTVTPGFLVATLLWGPVQERVMEYTSRGLAVLQAYEMAGNEVIAIQADRISFPRRFSLMAKEIWLMQPQLEQRRRRNISKILTRQRFRAAYDFVLLREQAGEIGLRSTIKFWTEKQNVLKTGERRNLSSHRPPEDRRGRRRRRGSSPKGRGE